MFISLDGFGPEANASTWAQGEMDEVLETFLNQIPMENTFQDVSIIIFDIEEQSDCKTGLMILN